MVSLCLDHKLKKDQYYQMFRYQILVEYVGTNFRGWQVQKKGKTIQGLIQEKISKLIKEKIILSDQSEFNEEYDLKKLVEPTDRKNKMMDKTSSLLGELKSNSLWDTIQEEELLPSKWIWNNYNKYL